MVRRSPLFDSVTVELVMQAFDEVCARVEMPLSQEARELVAKRIIGSAALGERDPDKMRDDALAFISS